jgi:hypothetical protein
MQPHNEKTTPGCVQPRNGKCTSKCLQPHYGKCTSKCIRRHLGKCKPNCEEHITCTVSSVGCGSYTNYLIEMTDHPLSARWSTSKTHLENTGGKFAFVDYKSNIMEIFNIVHINTSENRKEYYRPKWFDDEKSGGTRYTGVLLLSEKCGECSFDSYKEAIGYNIKHSLQGTTRSGFNQNALDLIETNQTLWKRWPNSIALPDIPFKKQWRSQNILLTTLQMLTREKFVSCRPDWLRNGHTGRSLEIDCFCESLNFGAEYNGIQHYKPGYYNRTQADVDAQQVRDDIKQVRCAERGITLIVVSYTQLTFNNTEQEWFDHVRPQLIAAGISTFE